MARWVDDINRLAGKSWIRLAQNREKWRKRLMSCSGMIIVEDDDDKIQAFNR